MAIIKIDNSVYLDDNWEDEILSKNAVKLGHYSLDFTNKDNGLEPLISAGGLIDISGVLYKLDSNESINNLTTVNDGLIQIFIELNAGVPSINAYDEGTITTEYNHKLLGSYSTIDTSKRLILTLKKLTGDYTNYTNYTNFDFDSFENLDDLLIKSALIENCNITDNIIANSYGTLGQTEQHNGHIQVDGNLTTDGVLQADGSFIATQGVISYGDIQGRRLAAYEEWIFPNELQYTVYTFYKDFVFNPLDRIQVYGMYNGNIITSIINSSPTNIEFRSPTDSVILTVYDNPSGLLPFDLFITRSRY